MAATPIAIFANNDTTTLAGAVSSVATSLNVAAGTGSLFPNPGTNQYFTLTLRDSATRLLMEIVWVTARIGDTFTIVRAQEGTTALNWLSNDLCGNLLTAATVNSFAQPPAMQVAAGGYAVDTGAANALVVTLAPVPYNYAAITGAPIRVKVSVTNTTAATINVNTLGTKSIVGPNGVALTAGQLVAGGVATVVYDGTNFQLQSISSQPMQLSNNVATASGAYSFTIPAGVTRAKTTLVGGGAGGGGCTTSTSAGGGGGGGMSIIWLTGLVPGQTISGTVGALGAGGASGANIGIAGGNSTLLLNGTLLATSAGGLPGNTGATPSGGAGGAVTLTGAAAGYVAVSLNGSYAGDGVVSAGVGGILGGNGAPGYLGAGSGRAGAAGGTSATAAGAGGGGAFSGSLTGAAGAGGNGYNGIVIAEFS